MERAFGVLLLLHVAATSSGVANDTVDSSIIFPLPEQSSKDSTPNMTIFVASPYRPLNLSGSEEALADAALDHFYPPAQGDATKRNSVPRKGITKEPVKPRKGAEQPPVEHGNITSTSSTTFKLKPLASETESTEDEVSTQPDYTALIVGLSLGIAMVLILASVTYWRLRDVWERRQYKRVDFLIDGLYTDT